MYHTYLLLLFQGTVICKRESYTSTSFMLSVYNHSLLINNSNAWCVLTKWTTLVVVPFLSLDKTNTRHSQKMNSIRFILNSRLTSKYCTRNCTNLYSEVSFFLMYKTYTLDWDLFDISLTLYRIVITWVSLHTYNHCVMAFPLTTEIIQKLSHTWQRDVFKRPCSPVK